MSSELNRHQAASPAREVSVAATYSEVVSHHVHGRGEGHILTESDTVGTTSRRLLAQFAVTRVEIGSFRNVKTSALDTAGYCRRLFEQDESELSSEPQPHQGHDEKYLVDNRCSGQVTAWLCLACGDPALEISHEWIRALVYSPVTRMLHIELCPSMFEVRVFSFIPLIFLLVKYFVGDLVREE